MRYIIVTRPSFLQIKFIKMANVSFTVSTYDRERIREAGGNPDRFKNMYNALISCFQMG
jgi:hypothetical protein